MEKFTGKVWVLGDDIDTDIIIPTEYLALKTVNDMKPFAISLVYSFIITAGRKNQYLNCGGFYIFV